MRMNGVRARVEEGKRKRRKGRRSANKIAYIGHLPIAHRAWRGFNAKALSERERERERERKGGEKETSNAV